MKTDIILYFCYENEDELVLTRNQMTTLVESQVGTPTEIVYDKWESGSKNLIGLIQKMEFTSNGTVVIPSLAHFDGFVGDTDQLLALVTKLCTSGLNIISIADKLTTGERASQFLNLFDSGLRNARAQLKSARIRRSKTAAKLSGETSVAIKFSHNSRILELRKKGLTIKQIAVELGVSTWPIQEALKIRRNESDLT